MYHSLQPPLSVKDFLSTKEFGGLPKSMLPWPVGLRQRTLTDFETAITGNSDSNPSF